MLSRVFSKRKGREWERTESNYNLIFIPRDISDAVVPQEVQYQFTTALIPRDCLNPVLWVERHGDDVNRFN